MSVDKQRENNGKRPGGVTGKGFRPGQSGNPRGRPSKERCLADWITQLASETDITGMSYEERVARAVYRAAIGGNMSAAKLILDRIEPRPKGQDVYLRDQLDELESTFDLLKVHRNRSALEN